MKIRMNRWIAVAGLGVATTLLAGAARSADNATTRTGPYLGGSVGVVEAQTQATGLAPLTDADDAGAGRIRAGYWLSRHWGVEASYTRVGRVEQTFSSGTFRGRGDSIAISGMGRVPFAERWALVGKVSLNSTRIRDDGSTGSTAGFDKYRGRSGNLVLPGLALEYAVNDRLAVTLEADSLGKAGDKLQLGYGAIGLRWSF